jgi:hypothetical protein
MGRVQLEQQQARAGQREQLGPQQQQVVAMASCNKLLAA